MPDSKKGKKSPGAFFACMQRYKIDASVYSAEKYMFLKSPKNRAFQNFTLL